MKLRNLFLGLFAATALIVSCDPKDEDLGAPSITLNETELVFAQEGETKTITVKATRDWKVELGGVDWLAFSPESGKASLDGQTVQVTALPNNGVNREASIKITIGMVSKSLTVTQAGTQGSPEDLIIYSNNFDKTVATQTYGSGSSWPFLDQFDGWQNATGTGLEGHEYSYKGGSVRANSFSNDKYSDYPGSGNNNIFFGANSYFSVNKIALGGATNIEISFGGSKYIKDANNLFSPAEFHVWLSSDGQKWVDASYTFTGTVEGKWNIAKGTYNVAGVEKLYVCLQPDLASAFRIDDLKIVLTDIDGVPVDFANGVAKDFGTGTGGPTPPGPDVPADAVYANNFDLTAAVNNNGWPTLDVNTSVWDNKVGTGASTVTYAYGGTMTVRTSGKLSNDTAGYSHYPGSGVNKIFYGGAPSTFRIHSISLGTSLNYTLTFGAQKYKQNGDNVLNPEELKVYLSNDNTKWVPVTYTYPDGADLDGDWNLATANFTLPAGTSSLGIAFVCSASSVYSMDDVLLVPSSSAGTAIDFAGGIELDGGEITPPTSAEKKTVQEFITTADTQTYYELTGTVSSFNSTYFSFDLTDETGTIYVYSVLSASKTEWAGKISNGGTITIYGKYDYYADGAKHEVVDAHIVNFTAGEGGEDGEDPEDPPAPDGDYEPGVTWTLGTNSYDATKDQTATVNGVAVSNLLKLGTSKATGKATIDIPAGTVKLGFYCVGWKGQNASTVKFSGEGMTAVEITPQANVGATGSAPYTLTITTDDYYYVEVPSGVTAVDVETTNTSQGRVLLIGMKAFSE